MATITTREVGTSNVGRPLTNSEIDNNFLGLNSDITTILNTISSGTTNVPKITSIIITDSSYNNITANAIDLSGGYIKITGTGFTNGCQVLVNNTLATSVTFISSTEVRAQLPAQSAGSYIIYLVLSDGSVAIRVNAVTYSNTPTWTSTSPIYTGTVINIQLAATSDSTVTYALASGSTLPTGVSLSSSGLLSGTVTGLNVDTVYSFTITATDIEQQVSPKTFSVTIVVGDPYFSYVPLLLETGSTNSRSTTVADGALTPNTVTRNNSVSTGWTSPYQTDGYWSNYFNGSSQLSLSNNADFEIGAGNFSYEAFVYATKGTNTYTQGILSYGIAGSVGSSTCSMDISSTGFFTLSYATGAALTLTDPASFPLNQWVHCVACRSGSTISLFVNGVRKATATTSATVGTGGAMVIGGQWYANESARQLQNGYISNARVLKGASAYNATLTTLTVPTAPLSPSTANQVLLTCYSNRFIDANTATTAKTITPSGTPSVQSGYYPFAAPTASPGAALFNGTNQYLNSTTATTAFQFGTSPFTVEFWTYQPSRPARQYLCGGLFSGPGFQIFMDSPGVLRSSVTTVIDLPSATIAVPLNAWTHIALVRTSTATNGASYYVNGVPAGTITISADISGTASSINVGASGNNSTSEGTNGYIANFRAVKGTAVYTGAFTPPSGPLTQTGGTYPSTTNVNTSIPAANTSLLLNLADSNYTSASSGGTNNTFIDDSNYAFTITRNGTPTQGSRTPYWPNGQWSNYFASNGDYISVPDSANVELGASDFQMSAWVYLTAYAASNLGSYASAILAKGNFAGTRSYEFLISGASGTSLGVVLTNAGGTTTDIGSAFSFALNTWYSVRASRVSNRVYLFVNGTLLNAGGTAYTDTVSNGTDALKVGRANLDVNYVFQLFGYVSNVSIAIGGTGYSTANYTPATTPTTATSDIKFLSCQSNRFKDNSSVPAVVSVFGTPSVQAFQPFSLAAPYSAATYAGSGYFNGSTDYLTAAYNSSFVFGTNDFTVECWIYLTSNPTLRGIFSLGYGANGSGPVTSTWQLRYWGTDGSNQISFSRYDGSTSTDYITSGAPIVVNNWYHIAVSRTGGTLKIFVNGISYYSGANTFNFTAISTSEPFQIGLSYYGPQAGLGGPRYFPGYISNARIINGTGVYSSNFDPPTTPVTNTAQTSLLLNMANAGIYDAAAQNNMTTVGTAQVATTPTSKWPPSSIYLNGSANYLTIPAGPQWLMSGDWTFEAWIYPTTVTGVQIIINTRNLSAVTSPVMYLNGSNLVIDTGAAAVVSAGTITINSWQYVAATRSGNAWKLFINGSQVGSTTTNTTFYSTAYGCAIGRSSAGENFNGYIQDVRVTNGVARTITTPTLAFPTR